MSKSIGTVKWFNPAKGFGVITQESGEEDVFVHFRAITSNWYTSLDAGQRVSYEIKQGPKGLEAADVTALLGELVNE